MNWQGFRDKAQSNLRAAQRLLDDNELDPSVSRAYYAVFHAAIAALLRLTSYRPRGHMWDHRAVAAEFARQLIRQRKVFVSDLADIPHDLRARRIEADYQSVGKKTASRCLNKAQQFVQAVVSELGRQS